MINRNVCIERSNLYYYIRSTEVNEVKLVLRTLDLNYFRNRAWKFGRKVQNHRDSRSNAFCVLRVYLLPLPVEPPLDSQLVSSCRSTWRRCDRCQSPRRLTSKRRVCATAPAPECSKQGGQKRFKGHVASVEPKTPKAWSSRRQGLRRRRRLRG